MIFQHRFSPWSAADASAGVVPSRWYTDRSLATQHPTEVSHGSITLRIGIKLLNAAYNALDAAIDSAHG